MQTSTLGLLSSIVACLAASLAGAQSVKLSRFRLPVLAPVMDFELSANGSRVAFRVNEPAVGEEYGLYGAAADGSSAPILLHAADAGLVYGGYQLSADGAWVVYRVGTDSVRLFSAPTDGSGPARALCDSLVAGGSVEEFQIAGDGVVLRADADADDVFELYRTTLDGSGAPLKLNGPLAAGGSVREFRVSSDAAWVAYRADERVDEAFELFGVAADGSGPSRCLVPFRSFADVAPDFEISHDCLGVAYRSDQDVNAVIELYVVAIDGSSVPAKRSAPLVAGGNVSAFAIAPDDQHLVFRADALVDTKDELFVVPTFGGSCTRLSSAMGADRDVFLFRIDPLGQRVAYGSDELTNDRIELFTVPLDQSSLPQRLNPELTAPLSVLEFQFLPDGSRVVFVAGVGGFSAQAKLYSAPSDASTSAVTLCSSAWPGAKFWVSPDSARVVFQSDLRTEKLRELFTVPADANTPPVRLNGELSSYWTLNADWQVRLAPDGSRVFYAAYQWPPVISPPFLAAQGELFSVPSIGGESVHLSRGPKRTIDAAAGGLELTSDGKKVVAMVGSDLCAVDVDGDSNPVRLSHPLFNPDGLGGYALSPDGNWVVYQVLHSDDTFDLYAARLDGSGMPTCLTEDLEEELSAVTLYYPLRNDWNPFQISPDSRCVVFGAADSSFSHPARVYCAPLDGSSPTRILSVPGDNVTYYLTAVSADSQRVLYVRNEAAGPELVSVPIDESEPPQVLQTGGGPGRGLGWTGELFFQDVHRVLITSPNSDRILYLSDHEADDVFQLYSVPVDGSAAPVRLNGTLVNGGDVLLGGTYLAGYQMTPDGSQVVYLADALQNGRVELFVAPTDGSAPTQCLNDALPVGGSVVDYALSPDSAQVLYRADQETNGVLELYLAALDGSSSPRKISRLFTAGGDVLSQHFSPDSHWAIYRADAVVDGRTELYSVELPEGLPVRMNPPLAPGGQIRVPLRITTDSCRVVFAGDAALAGRVELFEAPLDGTRSATRVNGPLVYGGGVHDDSVNDPIAEARFELTPDGKSALYLAEEDRQNYVELYRGNLTKQPARRHKP